MSLLLRVGSRRCHPRKYPEAETPQSVLVGQNKGERENIATHLPDFLRRHFGSKTHNLLTLYVVSSGVEHDDNISVE